MQRSNHELRSQFEMDKFVACKPIKTSDITNDQVLNIVYIYNSVKPIIVK